MKREILFRGKRKFDEKWIEGYYVHFERMKNHCIYYTYKGNPLVDDIDPETICQYIGLTDKNGKKIFEGDIVKKKKKKIGKVVFNESHVAFMILEFEENIYHFINECWSNCIKIIGNIFDNPELLEK